MRSTMKKRFSLVLAVVLTVALFAALGVGVGGVAGAADVPNVSETITIGQSSDIHYFPIEHCYQDVNNDDYKLSEFYHSMTGDTKLVLESGMILNYLVHEVIKKAEAHTVPKYMVVSGDLCKNGERVALIDVANSLRYMQNKVREVQGYEDFQVLAIVGNHDLYNTDAALYTQEGGAAMPADIISAAQFALIFAGLGFPNANVVKEEGSVDLTEYLPAEYWYSDYTDGYQASKNADNLTFTYFNESLNKVNETADEGKLDLYFAIGDALNQLTYGVEIANSDFGFIIFDSTDRELVEDGAPIRVNATELDVLHAAGKASVLYGEKNGYVDVSTTLDYDAAKQALEGGEAVYRRSEYAHITGGRLKEEVIDWAEEYTAGQKAGKLGEKTFIASFHHNLLPHFEVEDDILKDFTLYNWEYTAKRFLDMGIRYTLTGHQHSSDVMDYTDAEGRTIYDIETGSAVSYESPRRYVTIVRYDCGGKLGEQFTSTLDATKDLKALKSSNITDKNTVSWDGEAERMYQEYAEAKAAYDAAPSPALKSAMDEKWTALVTAYKPYLAYIIKYDDINAYTYNEYISKDIYAILVDRVVDHFLTEDLFDGLPKTVGDMIRNVSVLPGIMPALGGAVEYIVDVALNGLYEDSDDDGIGNYPYTHPNGVTDTYNGAREYLLAIVNDLLFGIDGEEDFMLFGDDNLKSEVNDANKGKMCLRDMASFIMEAHTIGAEISMKDEYSDYEGVYDEKKYEPDEEFGFRSPLDKTYRMRMLAAVKDLHEQLISGKFADDLFNALLNPLFYDNDSLLKTLLRHEFDISKAVDKGMMDETDYSSLRDLFNNLPMLLDMLLPVLNQMLGTQITLPKDMPDSIDITKLTLNDLLDIALPVAKPLLGDMIGFNFVGDDIVSILQNALDGYVTDSFKVGLGGIADYLIISYATDVYADMSDFNDPTVPYVLQPYPEYKYGDVAMSYLSSLNVPSAVGASFNPATQSNGRVPSRLTANFDTAEPTTKYTFKFYTAEDVYATFAFEDENGNWNELSTSRADADADEEADYLDSEATKTFGGVNVHMETKTVPAYVPLIDLGLLCITHGEIVLEDEEGNETPIIYGQRDMSPKNSVIYYNVTTVTVSGLSADTTYRYDLLGSYATSGGEKISFSMTEFAKKNGYQGDAYTFTTAKEKTEDSFEFLTIADIQGMIQGMYDDSVKAVNALLLDERTKNFDFILNAGDMVDNGKNFNQWALALDTYRDLFANTTQIFAAGNHEDGKNAIATYFNYTLPMGANKKPLQEDITDGAFFSFDYANAHFVVLNTNDATSAGLGKVQRNWLERDLSRSTAKWKFVLMHKSLFSGGSHSYDAEVVAMRQQLVPLFAQYGVNVVFAGHDHTYTTTKLVKADGSVTSDNSGSVRYTGDGVMYVTLGTMGTKFYEYGENADVTPKFDADASILHTLDSQTFGKVTVSGDEITFTGYYYDRETNSLQRIGNEIVLSSVPMKNNDYLKWLIPVVVIAAIGIGVAIFFIVKKVRKQKRPAAEETTASDAPTEENA